MSISFITTSEEADKDEAPELAKLIVGLTSTTADEKTKKSWIELSLDVENCDLALTISSFDLKLLLYVIAELFKR